MRHSRATIVLAAALLAGTGLSWAMGGAMAQSRTVPAGDALEQTPPIDQTRNQMSPGDRVVVPIAPVPPSAAAPANPPVVQKSGEAAKPQ